MLQSEQEKGGGMKDNRTNPLIFKIIDEWLFLTLMVDVASFTADRCHHIVN